jgi:HEAT repeat protein
MTVRYLTAFFLIAIYAGNTVSAFSEKGTYRQYHFKYQDNNTTTLFPERLGQQKTAGSTFMSSFSFDGDLSIREYGQTDSTTYASLSFNEIRSNRFVLNGNDIFNDPAQFIEPYKNTEVFMAFNENREIKAFYFPTKTPQLFKTFMTMVAQEIQVSLDNEFKDGQGSKSWDRTEINQHGKGKVTYQVTDTSKDRIRLKKSRNHYEYPGLIAPDDRQAIHLDNTITLDKTGAVEAIKKQEVSHVTSRENSATVLDVKKSVSLVQKSAGTFESKVISNDFLDQFQKVLPGEFITDEAQEHELLAKKASFLSYHEIESWISTYKPDTVNNRANNAMFYRTTGFVELHPQSMEKLVDYATQQATTSQEKTLVINILAAVGNRNAQKAMRDMLNDPEIQKERQYGVYIQNFSFVDQKPEPETLSFLETLMTQKKGFVSYAAAHAFGAMIHKLYAGNEKERALSLNQKLIKKINQATTVKDKAEYVAALGNAGMTENNEFAGRLLKAKNPKIRAEAAMAFRKTETPDSRKVLLTVFADPERSVQRSAIQTYLHFSPEEQNLVEIQSQLDRELIQEANYYDMVNLMKKNSQTYPEITRQCLKLMIRKKLNDPDLEARIRSMLKKD